MDGDEHKNSVRKHVPFRTIMERYHAEIENNIFAAEVVCKEQRYSLWCAENNCPFARAKDSICGLETTNYHCGLERLRKYIGEHA